MFREMERILGLLEVKVTESPEVEVARRVFFAPIVAR